MAVVIGAASEQILVLVFRDFRGQKLTKRYALIGTALDVDIQNLVAAIDAATNAQVTAYVEVVRPLTGTKSAAVNAVERNISEVFEIAIKGVDATVTPNKLVYKTFLLPAPLGSLELTDGSPDPGSTVMNLLTADVAALLTFKQADGSMSTGGMVYDAAGTHHITLADVVDSY